jgi:type IV fimbrial biogenesis protein FimT|tara:strand:- start:1031 stop:1582 length:552 start_codon:yes stop_codon:yes gene_type:complete
MKPRQEGFSLIELLICISILSLLLTISLPSMTSFTGQQRVAVQIIEIRNSLQLARSLAVMQGKIWKVCMLDAQQNCVKQNGVSLVVFRDDNNDNQRNQDEKSAKTSTIEKLNIKLSASNRAYIRFKMTGESMESGNFEVCASDPNVIKGRQVIIYRSGRIRLSKDTNQDGYHESTSGLITCVI